MNKILNLSVILKIRHGNDVTETNMSPLRLSAQLHNTRSITNTTKC